jgi:hypothetical protein
MMKKHSKYNFTLLFFAGYLLLMSSLIFCAVSYEGGKKSSNSKNEVSAAFSTEMKKYEEKKVQKEIINKDKWKPSNAFIITAISIASVLDVVIILIWAWSSNRKETENRGLDKWTEKKWFWNLVALGIIQPENGRLVLKWKNLILFIALMVALKFYILKKLETRESTLQLWGV